MQWQICFKCSVCMKLCKQLEMPETVTTDERPTGFLHLDQLQEEANLSEGISMLEVAKLLLGSPSSKGKRGDCHQLLFSLPTPTKATIPLDKYNQRFSIALHHCFTSLSSQFLTQQKRQDPLLQSRVANSIFSILLGSLQLCSNAASNFSYKYRVSSKRHLDN